LFHPSLVHPSIHPFVHSFIYLFIYFFFPADVGLKWSELSKTLNPNFNWEAAIQAVSGNSDKLEEV